MAAVTIVRSAANQEFRRGLDRGGVVRTHILVVRDPVSIGVSARGRWEEVEDHSDVIAVSISSDEIKFTQIVQR